MVSAAHPALDKEQRKIQGLFDSIAPRYDLLNHVLSLQLDRVWRRRAVEELRPRPGGVYLDACCGTGDLSFAVQRHGDEFGTDAPPPRVVGSDFSLGMLTHGARKRVEERGRRGETARLPGFLAGDTLNLPFADRTFDGAAVAFGIRNVADLDAGLRELTRVVRPGGQVVLLEFTPIRVPVFGAVFHFYLRHILPRIGNWISRSEDRAYTYLNESIRRWPDGDALGDRMRDAGLCAIRWRALFPGNVAVHAGTRG